MIIDASVLRGTSYEKAVNYGMPHVGCFYSGSSVNSHRMNDERMCFVCGGRASNAHHEPPKGSTGTWNLRTEYGTFPLRPALIALCGSGTTGCHGARHNGLVGLRWVWDDEAMEALWFNGFLLSKGVKPHSPKLLEWGHWEIVEKEG